MLALTGTFAELAVLSTLLVTVPYVGGCAAAVVLARRGVALAGTPLGFRWLPLAAVIGIGSCVALVVLAARMGYNGPYVAGLVTLSTVLGLATLPFALGVLR